MLLGVVVICTLHIAKTGRALHLIAWFCNWVFWRFKLVVVVSVGRSTVKGYAKYV